MRSFPMHSASPLARISSSTPGFRPTSHIVLPLSRARRSLMRNALHFSPLGGCVEITAGRGADGDFCSAIGDSGPGVPEAQLVLIFQPFFRSDPMGGEAPNGYGLGLAIAQRVIATVHGRISAKNKAAGGLLVEIKLPVSYSGSLITGAGRPTSALSSVNIRPVVQSA